MVLKRALARLMAWYVEDVVEHVQAFTVASAQAQRALASRLEELEAVVPALDPQLRAELDALAPVADLKVWISPIVTALAGGVRSSPPW